MTSPDEHRRSTNPLSSTIKVQRNPANAREFPSELFRTSEYKYPEVRPGVWEEVASPVYMQHPSQQSMIFFKSGN